MEIIWKIFLFIIAIIILIMLIGAWPFFSKNDQPQITNKFPLLSPQEIEAINTKKFQLRLTFFCVLLTIAGFVLGGYCKYQETPTIERLYWLGVILIGIGPMLISFSLDDKIASSLYQKSGLRLQLVLILVSGIAELLFFIGKYSNENVPLRSYKGATIFLAFVGLWFFLLFRVIGKLNNNSSE
jgi:hypothetical protein